MMSQMFGGAGGMRGGPQGLPRQPQLSWQEIVKQHVPSAEQEEWLKTIEADNKRQQADVASKRFAAPPSRAYHITKKALPNVYAEVETLLASLLNEAVRVRNAEHHPKWKQYHENLVSHITQSGLAGVFARDLKEQLRRRVESDPDFQAARAQDPSRFPNIAAALQV
ncbi:hypothetical protein PINS_up010960 [Pythium insidiosum]|nr:hypothetical protein PINS_up010960 [Pythium insidiosum]